MDKEYKQSTYIFDKEKGIWYRENYKSISYSDGNKIESQLKNIIDHADDLSVMSAELAQYCKDWPTTYHLSRKRSNLLRPLKKSLKNKSVLEIGSGCGAISRYIAESGAKLTALEGSLIRASICASRCRDLDNVKVISDNFQSFYLDEKFDFVTLIGVLEYAPHFINGDDPVKIILEKAKSFLKPNGILIIAIENQLGLKYFARYPEDHIGKPMFGIEEHYNNNTVITFGKKDLGRRLLSIGLNEQQWWYPFPDYKMPNLLVFDSNIEDVNKFDLTTLIRSTCFSDRQTPRTVSFLQERAWVPIIRNGLLADMSNSFILLASQQKIDEQDSWVIYYATDRKEEYAKQVSFATGKHGEIITKQSRLYPKKIQSSKILKLILDNQPYIEGESWQDNLITITSTPDWSINDIIGWFDYWWKSLKQYKKDKGENITIDTDIDGSLLDALPRNLFRTKSEKGKFIDLEWIYGEKISVRFLIFRALLSSFFSLGICAKPKQGTPENIDNLIKLIFDLKKIYITDSDIEHFIKLESDIQAEVTGVRELSLEIYKQAYIHTHDTMLSDSYIYSLENKLSQCELTINLIQRSLSWRLTKPLRTVMLVVRYIKKVLSISSFKKKFRHQVHRVYHVIALISDAVEYSGGIISLFKKIYYIFKCQGLIGIKQSISIFFGDRNNYKKWIDYYDTLTSKKRHIIKQRIEGMAAKPFISVVMPTYNPNPIWLKDAIESVRKQLYDNWELCIADDVSTDQSIRSILEDYSRKDYRIKVIFRERNGHISAATNSAIELVKGDWIALMDHDDLLAEDALYWVAGAINKNPEVKLIYSDEDKMGEQGLQTRHSPYFKCDWNLDLFYSLNMFSHLGIFSKDLINTVGGFRVGLEGSQDYDLVLRCIEKIKFDQIYHIPRVLYHWRVHEESTAGSGDAKPYAVIAGKQALIDHLKRMNIAAIVEPVTFGYRIKYPLPEQLPLVSLIIPTRNGLDLIKQCISSILTKTDYSNYEIIIVDNGSDDSATLAYFDSLKSNPKIRIHRDDRPFNYSQLNNSAVEIANGEIIGLINNDIEVISSNWLSEMVSHALRPNVGAVGAKLLYPDNTLQHGGVVLGLGGCAGHSHAKFPKGSPGYFGRLDLVSNYSAVTAACLVIEKSIYQEVGGLNEVDLKIAFNDVDFCLKLREAGYWNVWTPYAELYHHESATRGEEDTPEKQARFNAEVAYMKKRWDKWIEHDPAYSPNLTLNYEDFSYAWPPRVDLLEDGV